jgi:hypothetical protein
LCAGRCRAEGLPRRQGEGVEAMTLLSPPWAGERLGWWAANRSPAVKKARYD